MQICKQVLEFPLKKSKKAKDLFYYESILDAEKYIMRWTHLLGQVS